MTPQLSDDGHCQINEDQLPELPDPTVTISGSKEDQRQQKRRKDQNQGVAKEREPVASCSTEDHQLFTLTDEEAIEVEDELELDEDDDATSNVCKTCQGIEAPRPRLEISYTIEDLDYVEANNRKQMRKHHTTDSRWAPGGYLSPDDALWDQRRSSSTGIPEVRRRCGCHDGPPSNSQEPRAFPELRKHHSAEIDKWSLKPDEPSTELRKHLSDDSRMAAIQNSGWSTLRVPEPGPNPRQRCTCPRRSLPVSTSPSSIASSPAPPPKIEIKAQESEKQPDPPAPVKPEPAPSSSAVKLPQQPHKARFLRNRWAGKAHASLPAEPVGAAKQAAKFFGRSTDESKTKSLREKMINSIRRSVSPEPPEKQMQKHLNNRVVRRLISPDIKVTNAKWMPYEIDSPLPSVGIRRREPPPKLSEIIWRDPYEESPYINLQLRPDVIQEMEEAEDEEDDGAGVSPTHNPPPEVDRSASPQDPDEEFRWRMFNQISPFPLFQGAWRDESPPLSPSRTPSPQPPMEPPVWELRTATPSPEPTAEPPPKPKPTIRDFKKHSTLRARLTGKYLGKSQDSAMTKSRPQLVHSRDQLNLPKLKLDKRSLSEEAPTRKRKESLGIWKMKGPVRAKSEEAGRAALRWGADDDEMREYITSL